MDYWYIFISFIISNVDCQMVGISVYPESIDENKNVTLTCTYNGTVNEIGVKWFNGTDTFGWIYDTSCTLFSTPGPSYDGSRIVPECNDTDNVYKLNIRATKYDHLTQWCCAFTLATDVLCTKAVQITLRATTSTSASTTTTTTRQQTTTAFETATTYKSKPAESTQVSTKNPKPGTKPEPIPDSLIIGVSVGGGVVLVIIIICCCYCCPGCPLYRFRKEKNYKAHPSQDAENHTTNRDETKTSLYGLSAANHANISQDNATQF